MTATYSSAVSGALAIAALALPLRAQPVQFNYDESKVPQYELPDPLVCADGTTVTSARDWVEKRRPEILELFRDQVYGRSPEPPANMRFEILEAGTVALGGLATRRQVRIHISSEVSFDLLIYVPRGAAGASPAFLAITFYGNSSVHGDPAILHSRSWIKDNKEFGIIGHLATDSTRGVRTHRYRVEETLRRGYAFCTVHYGDIDPDFDDGFKNGVHGALDDYEGERPPDAWGSIAGWAFGLSRCLDYLEQDADIDGGRVALLGHSRLGKTALWAGAQDQRFALVISNDSGCGGAALSRRQFGETVARINEAFPHWFAKNFHAYGKDVNALPVDQHMLISLIAPRPAYVASAVGDPWADPRGEFLAAKYAQPVYALFGDQGLLLDEQPQPDISVQGRIGYHLRSGVHDMTYADWAHYLDFADRHLAPQPPHTSGLLVVERARIECGGEYTGHLQGLDADGEAIYWSFTDAIVKTDRDGRLLARLDVVSHHGDLVVLGERLLVAVNFGSFNDAAGRADSWVYEYNSRDLSYVARYPLPELIHGAGGLTEMNGALCIVGGLPAEAADNLVYEYDMQLRFKKSHPLASGHTMMGIQTAEYAAGQLLLGCYGAPKVSLRVDRRMQLIDRQVQDCAYGVAAVAEGLFLIGRWDGARGKGSAEVCTLDRASGLFTAIAPAAFRLNNGVTAHRGASSEAPENSLAALQRAVDLGADWIEVDVRTSADGKLILMHDGRTGRVADHDVYVAESSWKELSRLDIAAIFRSSQRLSIGQCPVEAPPTLEAALRLIMQQERTRLSIQPKTDCTQQALALVARLNAGAWVGFNDSNPAKMALVKETDPQLTVFWDRPAQSDLAQDIRTAREHGFECLVIQAAGLTANKVQALHKAGLQVGAWTVNDPAQVRELRRLGVDRIYSDDPRMLLQPITD